MQYLLLHFGYAFLVLGLILEGDATLVAAMILASAGAEYFSMSWVVGIALGVTIGGNELMYEIGALGRMRGLLANSQHRQRVSRWLHNSRSGFLSLLFSRFMWGFRLMIPFAAGMLHIKRRRFSVANAIGGAIWVTVLAYFGVGIEQLFELLHNDLLRYQSHIAVALFLVGIVIGLATIPWQIVRRSRKKQRVAAALRLAKRRTVLPPRAAAKPPAAAVPAVWAQPREVAPPPPPH